MNKPKLEQRLEQLRQLRSATPNEEVVAALSKALKDRSNLIVAEAAKMMAELRLAQTVPALLETFDRLFEDPVKNDSKCWAKTAIVTALTELEYAESRPFIRGSRHIQMEPVWGGQEDAAPPYGRPACCRLEARAFHDPSRFSSQHGETRAIVSFEVCCCGP